MAMDGGAGAHLRRHAFRRSACGLHWLQTAALSRKWRTRRSQRSSCPKRASLRCTAASHAPRNAAQRRRPTEIAWRRRAAAMRSAHLSQYRMSVYRAHKPEAAEDAGLAPDAKGAGPVDLATHREAGMALRTALSSVGASPGSGTSRSGRRRGRNGRRLARSPAS